MRLLNPCVLTEPTTYDVQFHQSEAACVESNVAYHCSLPAVGTALNTLGSQTPTRESRRYFLPSGDQACFQHHRFLVKKEHTMSDDDDDDRPPTAEEEKEWRKLQLDRRRALNLAWISGGVATSISHDEWLRKKRREKRLKKKTAPASGKEPREASADDLDDGHYDDESSDSSTGTVKPNNRTVCTRFLSFNAPRRRLGLT